MPELLSGELLQYYTIFLFDKTGILGIIRQKTLTEMADIQDSLSLSPNKELRTDVTPQTVFPLF